MRATSSALISSSSAASARFLTVASSSAHSPCQRCRRSAFCAPLEAEIATLPPADQASFLKDYGLTEPARDRLIRTAYHTLNLISFFTVGEDEVRAWTIRRGDNAVTAAGKIHTDLARGFIRDPLLAQTLRCAQNERAFIRHYQKLKVMI